jgi:hypothetical protein
MIVSSISLSNTAVGSRQVGLPKHSEDARHKRDALDSVPFSDFKLSVLTIGLEATWANIMAIVLCLGNGFKAQKRSTKWNMGVQIIRYNIFVIFNELY